MSKMEHTHQKLLLKSNTIHCTTLAVPPGHPGANQPTFFKKTVIFRHQTGYFRVIYSGRRRNFPVMSPKIPKMLDFGQKMY